MLKLWYIGILLVALDAGWLRWKRVRGRRKQTVSSQKAISTVAGQPSTSVTSSQRFGLVKVNGEWYTPTGTLVPSSSPLPPGAQPVHIPEQRIRSDRMTLAGTSLIWLEPPIQEGQADGNIVGQSETCHNEDNKEAGA